MPVPRLISRAVFVTVACGGILFGASAAAQASEPVTAHEAVVVQLPHAGGLPGHWWHHDHGWGWWNDDNQCDDDSWWDNDDDCDCDNWG